MANVYVLQTSIWRAHRALSFVRPTQKTGEITERSRYVRPTQKIGEITERSRFVRPTQKTGETSE